MYFAMQRRRNTCLTFKPRLIAHLCARKRILCWLRNACNMQCVVNDASLQAQPKTKKKIMNLSTYTNRHTVPTKNFELPTYKYGSKNFLFVHERKMCTQKETGTQHEIESSNAM